MVLTTIQDNLYLSWQAELLALNCRELGRELTILIGWRNKPSDYALRLERDFGAVLIPDTRTDMSYAPSIQPYLLAQYCTTAAPVRPVLLVDSDVLFKSLDWLPAEMNQDVFISDCSSYISATYLNSTDPDLLNHLCMIAGIAPDYASNHPASGGAQYLLPHLFDPDMWERIERSSTAMHRFMQHYTCHSHPVQKWTASMWAILYELYRQEQSGRCRVCCSEDLKFCFATDPIQFWQDRNILHMAGVTKGMQGHFWKGGYTNNAPWECDLSHVLPGSCSYIYKEAIERLWSAVPSR